MVNSEEGFTRPLAVMEFSRMTQTADQLPATLAESQRQYLGHILLESFRWDRLTALCTKMLADLEDRTIPQQAAAYRQLSAMKSAVQGQAEVAGKFRGQLQALLRPGTSADYSRILERTAKAVGWFGPQIDDGLILFLEKHRDEWAELKRTKRYVADLQNAIDEFKRKREQLNQCLEIAENLSKNVSS